MTNEWVLIFSELNEPFWSDLSDRKIS